MFGASKDKKNNIAKRQKFNKIKTYIYYIYIQENQDLLNILN